MAPHTPLLRPDRYFAERRRDGTRTLVLLGLVVATGLGIVYGVGWLLTTHVNGTVLVDNPARPPEAFCDGNETGTLHNTSGCDAPKRIGRDVDSLIWSVIGELAGMMLVGLAVVIALLWMAVHAGSWLAGGENGLAASLAVTVWGLAPVAVTAPVSLAIL